MTPESGLAFGYRQHPTVRYPRAARHGKRRHITLAATWSRLALLPLIGLARWSAEPQITVVALILVAVIADIVDGVWARARSADTVARRVADAVVDRATTYAVLSMLSIGKPHMVSAVVVLAVRDATVALVCGRSLLAHRLLLHARGWHWCSSLLAAAWAIALSAPLPLVSQEVVAVATIVVSYGLTLDYVAAALGRPVPPVRLVTRRVGINNGGPAE